MEESKEFLQKEIHTEHDAIHPRFLPKQDTQQLNEYEIRNHFYCEQCKLFLAPKPEALNLHFHGEMVKHRYNHCCRYCGGPVYEYSLNHQTHYHHNCRDTSTSTNNVPEPKS